MDAQDPATSDAVVQLSLIRDAEAGMAWCEPGFRPTQAQCRLLTRKFNVRDLVGADWQLHRRGVEVGLGQEVLQDERLQEGCMIAVTQESAEQKNTIAPATRMHQQDGTNAIVSPPTNRQQQWRGAGSDVSEPPARLLLHRPALAHARHAAAA